MYNIIVSVDCYLLHQPDVEIFPMTIVLVRILRYLNKLIYYKLTLDDAQMRVNMLEIDCSKFEKFINVTLLSRKHNICYIHWQNHKLIFNTISYSRKVDLMTYLCSNFDYDKTS